MSNQRTNPRRVLIVEDDYYLATDAQLALEEAGAAVLGPCPDPASALALIDREPIDWALLDINLGNGPTFEVARALQSRGIPFTFVTGYDSPTIPDEFAGVERLEKPIRTHALVSAFARSG